MARPLVALFGYESSTFTIKIQHVLRLKQIPYTFVRVPTMMPRPILRENFHLTYRKIPVLSIGRELYCDSSIICEALEHFFPASQGFRSLYPPATDGRTYRPLIRGFASYWTDRPLFRVTCGLMPASIWRSEFGVDRAQLIGHKLDADKLERKFPENLAKLDTQLSLVEPLFADVEGSRWIFSTSEPSLADVALYYELLWGSEIAAGRYTAHITQGEKRDGELEGAGRVFNGERYPGVWGWFGRMRDFFEGLPVVEDKEMPLEKVLEEMKKASPLARGDLLLPTPMRTLGELEERTGLREGTLVSITPDDTGRDDPTIGTLIAMSPEEVVIEPKQLERPASIGTRIHFPRIGFVVRPANRSNL